jgi:uncharacterized protein
MVLITNKEKYKISKYLSLIIPSNYEKIITNRFKPTDKTLIKTINGLKKKVKQNDINKIIANTRCLNIGVTNQCNLRCKYCAYGGNYKLNRVHNVDRMNFDTYKKAISLYFELINSPYRNKKDNGVISFYGGEPLLEYENILKANDFAHELNNKININKTLNFLLTTNGILLTKNRLKELLNRNFMIDISLDGPKDQHDKFRVKVNQEGTFDDIMNTVSACTKKDLETIRFLVTIHPDHDLKKTEEFFLKNNDIFSEKNTIFSYISLLDLKSTIDQKLKDKKQYQFYQIENELNKDTWFFKKITYSWLDKFNVNPTLILGTQQDFTGSCFPGLDKIFVTPDGKIHICEKINSGFPIGHIKTGLNYNAIQKIESKWNNLIIKSECWDCEAWWLCNFCFATQAKEKKFVIDKNKHCKHYLSSIKSSIIHLLNNLEKNDKVQNTNCYADINTFLDSL